MIWNSGAPNDGGCCGCRTGACDPCFPRCGHPEDEVAEARPFLKDFDTIELTPNTACVGATLTEWDGFFRGWGNFSKYCYWTTDWEGEGNYFIPQPGWSWQNRNVTINLVRDLYVGWEGFWRLSVQCFGYDTVTQCSHPVPGTDCCSYVMWWGVLAPDPDAHSTPFGIYQYDSDFPVPVTGGCSSTINVPNNTTPDLEIILAVPPP